MNKQKKIKCKQVSNQTVKKLNSYDMLTVPKFYYKIQNTIKIQVSTFLLHLNNIRMCYIYSISCHADMWIR